MQPAFSGTRFPPPSSSAAVFTGIDRSSTGRAADTWIPAVMQRVGRNAVRLDVWVYIKTYGVPYNALHDRGDPSIGFPPCTRAVDPGEDSRAGRWWWGSGFRECRSPG